LTGSIVEGQFIWSLHSGVVFWQAEDGLETLQWNEKVLLLSDTGSCQACMETISISQLGGCLWITVEINGHRKGKLYSKSHQMLEQKLLQKHPLRNVCVNGGKFCVAKVADGRV